MQVQTVIAFGFYLGDSASHLLCVEETPFEQLLTVQCCLRWQAWSACTCMPTLARFAPITQLIHITCEQSDRSGHTLYSK